MQTSKVQFRSPAYIEKIQQKPFSLAFPVSEDQQIDKDHSSSHQLQPNKTSLNLVLTLAPDCNGVCVSKLLGYGMDPVKTHEPQAHF